MLVSDILKDSSKNFPDKEAIVSKNKRLSYSKIQRMVNQLANAFIEEGIKKGDRVAILLRNTSEAVTAYFAVLKIGAIEVALNPIADSHQNITYKLNDCEPKALITDSLYINLISDALSKVSSLKTIYFTGDISVFKNYKNKAIILEKVFENQKPEDPNISLEESDLAIIAYTSGTTGAPKGVMLTHANLISGAEAMSRDMRYDSEDRTLSLIPLNHAYGKSVLNSRFGKGATVVLIENISFTEEVLKLIEKEKVTGIVGVPTIYKMLLEALKSEKTYQFEHLKYISTGGAKMPTERFIELWERFPRVTILSGYGLTEISGKAFRSIFSKEPLNKNKLNSCGKIIANHKMAIINEAGKKVKIGEIGEVLFKGPGVMKGYWKKAKETVEVLKDGWLYTGDMGKINKDGEIYLVDRKKDIIKSGGELIAPKEIEIVIDSHPCVKESAVIGIEDELMGEKIKAFVVLKPKKKVTKEEIIEFCSESLPPIKIPSTIEFRSSLPKSTLDKIKKSELRKE